MLEINKIYNQDCLDGLKQIDTDIIDCIVTDPPYQLCSTKKQGFDWKPEGFDGTTVFTRHGKFQEQAKSGFMGKEWDVLPPVDVWKESLRVLKPGAFAFIMTTPRQDSLCQILNDLSTAGFAMGFSSIYWTYASGFPKAMNISKSMDKKNGVEREIIGKKPWTNSAHHFSNGKDHSERVLLDETIPIHPISKSLAGSYAGFQPKPAIEIILVVMKPLSEKTYINQALKNGKGINWLDDCRIPYQSDDDKESARFGTQTDIRGNAYGTNRPSDGHIYAKNVLSSQQGRFPANLLVSDDVLNDGIKRDSNVSEKPCNTPNLNTWGGTIQTNRGVRGYDDSGSFSRYFDIDKWFKKQIENLSSEVQKTFPFLICEKADKTERNIGCGKLPFGEPPASARSKPAEGRKNALGEPRQNFHPTCKPIKLMMYLITLGSRKNDIILDPFIGSGTTAISSKLLGRHFIGFEIEKEYFDIANERLKLIHEYYDHESETVQRIETKSSTIDKWLL